MFSASHTAEELMILVAGATGLLGSEICRRLRGRGEKVRGLTRSTSAADKVAALENVGVEIVRGDFKDRKSLDAACRGVDVVISTVTIIATAQPGDSFAATDRDGTIALIDAAKQAGARQFIFVSFDTSSVPDAPLINAKREVEAHLERSGMDYTILKPGYFMEVWLGPMLFADTEAGTARIYGAGTNPLSYVAVSDVAEVAVRCANNPAARNASVPFGGDEVSQREALSIFEDVFGKPFNVTEVPEAGLEAQWSSATDDFSLTFSALMLSAARGGIGGAPGQGTLFPERWRSVREHTAARLTSSV
jgi:uncharacterized protein YbjT (DUF2867 family)